VTVTHLKYNSITCSKCNGALSRLMFNTPDFKSCPSCGVPLKIDVFPSLFNPPVSGQSGHIVLNDHESGCFYHPKKQAVVPCDYCGRFLCALCDMELNDQHLCPACLEKGKKKGRLKSLQNHRVLYDDTPLRLAVYPLLIFWLTIITAPMVFYFAIRYWNKPTSIIPRTKIRFVIALSLAGLQISGWGILVFSLL